MKLSTSEVVLDDLSPANQQRLAEVLEACLDDMEHGRQPDADALVARNPELAGAIRTFLGSLDFVCAATSAMRDDAPPAVMETARQLGDYAMIREIGRGGMGVVYEARQISLGRRVALKVLPFAAVLDRRQVARFHNEAQAAAHLQHPHIVPVFSSGCDRGVHFYAMQYIEGQSLDLAICQLRQLAAPSADATDMNPNRERGEMSPRRQQADESSTSRRECGRPNLGYETKPFPIPALGVGAAANAAPTERKPAATLRQAASRWKPVSSAEELQRGEFFRMVARLGADAAEALEYAHQCGVVHRDIKPSNLLLDEQGQVWITDFGLARFDANASLTATGDVLGTLRYMSPEQVAGKPAMVDGRSDVYSLGVTLYELATLREAFPGGDRETLLTRIAREEPRAPRQVNRALPADLETVMLKAIAKSPGDRYLSAKDLADDLRRFLEGKAVLARRAGIVDRAGKWARRHRTIVAAAAVSLAAVLVASLVGTFMIAAAQSNTKAALAQAEKNLKASEANLLRANTHFRQLREVVDRFGAYHAERMKELPGVEPLRRELLLDTLNYYRGFIRYAGDDPELRADLAVTWSKSAGVADELGDKAAALAGYREAAKAFQQLAAAHPGETRYDADLALCHNNLGLLLAAAGKTAEAEKAYAAALEIQRRLVAADPAAADFQRDLALTYSNLGLLARSINQPARAEENYREAIRIQERLAAEHVDQPEHRHRLAISYNNLGFLQAKTDPRKAEESAEKARAIEENLVAAHPDNAEYRSDLALACNNLAALKTYNGQAAEAAASYGRAIGIQRQLVRNSSAVTRYRRDLAISHNNLGRLYSNLKNTEKARKSFEEARTIMQELVDDDRDDLSYRSSLGCIENNLGEVLDSLHRSEEAAAMYDKAIQSQQFCCERAPQVAEFREFLGRHYDNDRRVLAGLGRWQKYFEVTRAEFSSPVNLNHLQGQLPSCLYERTTAASAAWRWSASRTASCWPRSSLQPAWRIS